MPWHCSITTWPSGSPRAVADAGGGREAEYTLGEAIAGAGRPAEGKEVLDGLSPHEMTGLERTQLAITRSWRAIDRWVGDAKSGWRGTGAHR